MTAARRKDARELTRKTKQEFDAAVMKALDAVDDARLALQKRNVPLKRVALTAYQAHLVLADLWSEATWLATHRRDLARARAGKRRLLAPGWRNPARRAA